MDKDTAKALMRAEAAEALLEELRDRNEELEAENARLKAQLEGKPPAEHKKAPAADKLLNRFEYELLDPALNPKFSAELIRQIMEMQPREIWRDRPQRPERLPPKHFEFRAEVHPFNGDMRVSMYYDDDDGSGERKVLSYVANLRSSPPHYVPRVAAEQLLAGFAKERKLGSVPKEVLDQTTEEIRRVIDKARGRKW